MPNPQLAPCRTDKEMLPLLGVATFRGTVAGWRSIPRMASGQDGLPLALDHTDDPCRTAWSPCFPGLWTKGRGPIAALAMAPVEQLGPPASRACGPRVVDPSLLVISPAPLAP